MAKVDSPCYASDSERQSQLCCGLSPVHLAADTAAGAPRPPAPATKAQPSRSGGGDGGDDGEDGPFSARVAVAAVTVLRPLPRDAGRRNSLDNPCHASDQPKWVLENL